MKPRANVLQFGGILLLALVGSLTTAHAQVPAVASEREYAYAETDVKNGLQKLGAYSGARLPMLEGFVESDPTQLVGFERPYYQFRVEVVPLATDRTMLRLNAQISAWYTDPKTSQSEYRALSSNGRLESDLLDRLEGYLKKTESDLPARVNALEKQIADTRSQREALQQQETQLRNQVQEMEDAVRAQGAVLKLVSVKHANTDVMAHPGGVVPVFRAVPEDQFEVVGERGEWVELKLAANSTGWIRKSQVSLGSTLAPAPFQATKPDEIDSEFAVTREDVTLFLGDWPGLKGKRALFVWARPLGITSDAALAHKKLAYAKQVFAERYREAAHSPSSFAGIVVIFVGNRGGIAAAKLDDVGQWVEGDLPDPAFLKRCSLDPPEVFSRELSRR